MYKQVLTLAAFCLLASGCTTTQPEADRWPAPNFNQEQIAVGAYILQTFKDPSSVTDLTIEAPYYGVSWMNSLSYRNLNDWVITFRCNAKNSFGGYTGLQMHHVLWNGGINWADQQQLASDAQ